MGSKGESNISEKESEPSLSAPPGPLFVFPQTNNFVAKN